MIEYGEEELWQDPMRYHVESASDTVAHLVWISDLGKQVHVFVPRTYPGLDLSESPTCGPTWCKLDGNTVRIQARYQTPTYFILGTSGVNSGLVRQLQMTFGTESSKWVEAQLRNLVGGNIRNQIDNLYKKLRLVKA